MAKMIGIDLGASKAVMGVYIGETFKIIPNLEGENYTPMAVALYKGELLVGRSAFDYGTYGSASESLISFGKILNRGQDDRFTEKIIDENGITFSPNVNCMNNIKLLLGNQEYSIVDIYALMLRKLKTDAEEFLGDRICQAVVTVPPHFSESQKSIIRKAGKIAEMIIILLPDNIAAALVYRGNGLDCCISEDEVLLIYDFGATNLDISIIQATGNVFAELAIVGDNYLGGEDINGLMIDYILNKSKESLSQLVTLEISPIYKERVDNLLWQEVENAKRQLSYYNKVHIYVPGVFGYGNPTYYDLDMEIERHEFENLIKPLIQRSVDRIHDALGKACVNPNQIDRVLLVGGSTLIPLVQQSLQGLFGEDRLYFNSDPLIYVAQGAAIKAVAQSEPLTCPRCGTFSEINSIKCSSCGLMFCQLENVTGLSYWVKVMDNETGLIFPKGTCYPTSSPANKIFLTKRDDQRNIEIAIYQGENPQPSENELVQKLKIDLPGNLPTSTPLSVRFSLDEHGLLGAEVFTLNDSYHRTTYPEVDGGSESEILNRVHISTRSHIDYFLFSAFYPEKIALGNISKIVAFAHLESCAKEVAREAAKRLDLPRDVKMRIKSEKPERPLPRASVIKVTPEVPGLVFDKKEDTMTLWEDKQAVEFRFKPHPDYYGRSCQGFIQFWFEGLILAAVPVSIFVAEEEVPEIFREALAEANARPYRYVFPSYSHQDARIVELMEGYAQSFGDVYLRDLTQLRAGQRWQEELRRFITKADVFQLFWSENAAASAYVQDEWHEALEERKGRPDPFFVRPVYWTDKAEPPPIPPELHEIHFARLPL
jgi:molecular chaperone DnaK